MTYCRQLFLHTWNQPGRVLVVYLTQDFVWQAGSFVASPADRQ